MRSFLRRLLRVALVLAAALALATAAALWLLDRAATPARAEALLAGALGLEVRVGGVETSWLPPSVVVTGVEAPPALRVGRARIEPALGALLRGRVAVGELHLERADLALLLREDGGLAFATGAPGGVPLGGGAPGEALAALPDVHVRDADLTLRDGAGDAQPLRLALARLDVDALPLLGMRVRLRASLGPEGRHGSVELDARLAGLAGLGGDPADDPELRLRLRARRLDAGALGGWLPAATGVRAGPARLDLDLELEGRRGDVFQATAELARGSVEVGPVALGAPARASGRLVDAPERLRLEDATVEAEHATWNGVRSGRVHAQFAWDSAALEVHALDVEDLRTGGDAAPGAALGLDLHVRRAEQLALTGLRLGDDADTPTTLERLEAAGIDLVLEPAAEGGAAGDLPVRVERLVLTDLAPERTASFRAEARVPRVPGSEGGRTGHLRLEGRLGPWAPGGALRAQPLSFQLALERVEAARVAPLLPEAWGVEATPGTPLDVSADLEGPSPGALRGRVAAQLGDGHLRLAGLALDGPGQLEGRLALHGDGDRDAAPTLRDAWLEASGSSLGPVRAAATRARFAWREDALHLERLELAGVRLHEDAGRLGAAPGAGASLTVRSAEELVVEGIRWPGDPASRTPWLPRRVEARRCDLTVHLGLRPDAPDVDLLVESMRASGLEPGGRARVSLEGRLADAAGEARLRGRAVLAPFAPEAPLAPQIRELEIALRDADATSVIHQLPEGVAPDAATGRLDASLALAPAQDASVAGSLVVDLREGRVALAALGLPAPVHLEAALSLARDGVPTVGDATMEAAEGTWRQTGTLVLAETPSLDVRWAVEGVAAWKALAFEEEAARAGDAPPASPRLDAHLTAQGPLHEGRARFQALRGEGRIALTGGELPSSELLLAVGRALARRVGVDPADADVRRIPLNSAAATLRLESGRLRTDDLAVDTGEYSLTGRGHVSLEGEVDLQTLVSFRPAGVSRLLGVLDVTRPLTGDLLGLPPVPVAIGGTLADPRFRPEASRLPVAWARSLLQLPGRALESVTETGRRLGRGLQSLIPGRDRDGDAEPAEPEADQRP